MDNSSNTSGRTVIDHARIAENGIASAESTDREAKSGIGGQRNSVSTGAPSGELNVLKGPRREHGHGMHNVGEIERLASVAGGAMVAALGLRKGGATGLALGALAVSLLHRGTTGHCEIYHALGVNTAERLHTAGAALNGQGGIKVEKSITVTKPAAELFRFWRNFGNLARFMKHLESVHQIDNKRSRWVAKAPAGTTVEWEAEIINEREGELIAWRSLPGSEIDNAGSVRFENAPGNRGTVVKVAFIYNPPAGKLGAAIARMFGEEPSLQVEEDLRRFKQLMETGEIPATNGQTSGRNDA